MIRTQALPAPPQAVRASRPGEPEAGYLKDASRYAGSCDGILFPRSEPEIAQVLRDASENRTPVTVSGAGTGLTGARVPHGGLLLCTDRLARIISIRPDGGSVVQPGVPLSELEQALDQRGFFHPPDPGEKRAFAGGTVATNASGPRSFKYGATRVWVRRLRVVLAGGELLEVRRGQERADASGFPIETGRGQVRVPLPRYRTPEVKNAAGYFAQDRMDLIDLFIGSEGTLGVITEIEFAAVRKPASSLAGVIFFDSEAECARFARTVRDLARSGGGELDARVLEFFDSRSLALLSKKHATIPAGTNAALYVEQELEAGARAERAQARWLAQAAETGAMRDSWFSDQSRGQRFLREFRHDLPVLVNERVAANKFRKIGTDFAVPDASAEPMLDFYLRTLARERIDYALFGHIGDNNLHLNLLPATEAEFARSLELYALFARKAVELGGTVSAEHGIGKLRIPYLEMMVGREGLREMAAVKKSLDPAGILNRGNIVPPELLGPG